MDGHTDPLASRHDGFGHENDQAGHTAPLGQLSIDSVDDVFTENPTDNPTTWTEQYNHEHVPNRSVGYSGAIAHAMPLQHPASDAFFTAQHANSVGGFGYNGHAVLHSLEGIGNNSGGSSNPALTRSHESTIAHGSFLDPFPLSSNTSSFRSDEPFTPDLRRLIDEACANLADADDLLKGLPMRDHVQVPGHFNTPLEFLPADLATNVHHGGRTLTDGKTQYSPFHQSMGPPPVFNLPPARIQAPHSLRHGRMTHSNASVAGSNNEHHYDSIAGGLSEPTGGTYSRQGANNSQLPLSQMIDAPRSNRYGQSPAGVHQIQQQTVPSRMPNLSTDLTSSSDHEDTTEQPFRPFRSDLRANMSDPTNMDRVETQPADPEALVTNSFKLKCATNDDESYDGEHDDEEGWEGFSDDDESPFNNVGTAHNAFMELFFPTSGEMTKLNIPGDDVQAVKNKELGHELSNEMFEALLHDPAAAPEQWSQQTKNKYADQQTRAEEQIKNLLQTEKDIENACRRIKLVVDAAVRLHEHGVPKELLDQNGTRLKSGYTLDRKSTCLARVETMIAAVKDNKLVAKDVLTIDHLVDFARAPARYLQRKLTNVQVNGTKEESMRLGQRLKEANKAGTPGSSMIGGPSALATQQPSGSSTSKKLKAKASSNNLPSASASGSSKSVSGSLSSADTTNKKRKLDISNSRSSKGSK